MSENDKDASGSTEDVDASAISIYLAQRAQNDADGVTITDENFEVPLEESDLPKHYR